MNKLETESKIKKVLIVIMMILAFIIIAIYIYNMISIATTGVDIYVSGFYNNQVSKYNSSFEDYIGTQNGRNVKKLIQEVFEKNEDNYFDAILCVKINDGNYLNIPNYKVISDNKRYKVDVTKYTKMGLIKYISIQEIK